MGFTSDKQIFSAGILENNFGMYVYDSYPVQIIISQPSKDTLLKLPYNVVTE